MAISPLAGKPAPKDMLVDLARLEREYYACRPDVDDPNQRVSFGTSGHRGSPLHGSFTEAHILAITQAICDYRRGQGTDGPLYVGKDTHALSCPTSRICEISSTWTPSAPPTLNSEWTRSAARPGPTGSQSTPSITWTSPWSTRPSIQPSRS